MRDFGDNAKLVNTVRFETGVFCEPFANFSTQMGSRRHNVPDSRQPANISVVK
jgi:hypothetical protein